MDKDPEILKKFSKAIWEAPPDDKSKMAVSTEKCVEIIDKLSPGFAEWYWGNGALQCNSYTGYRFTAIAWPTENDLTIVHWETKFDPKIKGMYERSVNLAKVTIIIYKENNLVFSTTTILRDGHIVMRQFLGDMRDKYKAPFKIRVELEAKPKMVDEFIMNY